MSTQINAPLAINGQNVYRGQDRSNGFVMRNSDGRIMALKEGFAKLTIGGSNAFYTPGAVPFGNALWRDTATIDTLSGTVQADKPTKGWLVGVLQFEQGLQSGHPMQNWGIPTFSKGTLVRQGLVGYKQTMTAVGQEANYLALLQGDTTKDTGTTRKVYADWMATLKAGADGDRLGLFFGNASGLPIISLVLAANIAAPTLANTTFGGWVTILEPENGAVFVDLLVK